MNKLLNELTNLAVVSLVLCMILGFAIIKWSVIVTALLKFYSI